MASAPQPGRRDAPPQFFRIRFQDRTLELTTAPTIGEKMAVRSATGMPFEAFFTGGETSFGEDSLVVLWWLARRQNGEPRLAFRDVADNWPVIGEDDIDLTIVDLDDPESQEGEESPEGSGPVS